MVGSPFPAPPRKVESLTQDSSFLSLVPTSTHVAERSDDLPGECSYVVHYAYHQFSLLGVYTHDQRVVHDVEIGKEEG